MQIKVEEVKKLDFNISKFELIESKYQEKSLFCTFDVNLKAQHNEKDYMLNLVVKAASLPGEDCELSGFCEKMGCFLVNENDDKKPNFLVIPSKLHWQNEDKPAEQFTVNHLAYLASGWKSKILETINEEYPAKQIFEEFYNSGNKIPTELFNRSNNGNDKIIFCDNGGLMVDGGENGSFGFSTSITKDLFLEMKKYFEDKQNEQ